MINKNYNINATKKHAVKRVKVAQLPRLRQHFFDIKYKVKPLLGHNL